MPVDRNEDGMTLVELVVATLILGIIILPLGSSVILGLGRTEQAAQRTTNTADQQVLASYFVNDVQSAADVAVPPAAAACGVTDPLVVQFHWVDPVGTVDKTVVYSAPTTGTSAGEMVRVFCDSTGVTRTATVIHALASVPSPKCDGVTCTAATPTPQVVALQVASRGTTGTDPSSETYTFNLSASRRMT
jgi:prepilin-type N-terminal cleavage/methylation domain-containing protein